MTTAEFNGRASTQLLFIVSPADYANNFTRVLSKLAHAQLASDPSRVYSAFPKHHPCHRSEVLRDISWRCNRKNVALVKIPRTRATRKNRGALPRCVRRQVVPAFLIDKIIMNVRMVGTVMREGRDRTVCSFDEYCRGKKCQRLLFNYLPGGQANIRGLASA